MHLRWIESTRRTRYIREYAAPDLSLVNLDQQPPRRDQTNQKPRRGLKIEEYDSFDDETVLALIAAINLINQEGFQCGQRESREFKLEVDVSYFNGNLSIVDSLNWLPKIDSRFSDYMKVPEHHQVKLLSGRSIN